MYIGKIHKEMLKIGGLCDRITVEELEYLINKCNLFDYLSQLEQYMLKSRYEKDNSFIYIAYETGFKTSSSVSAKIKRCIHKLIAAANKLTKHFKDDPIRYLVSESIVKNSLIAKDKNTTISDYMCWCDLSPDSMVKSDVAITMEILKLKLGFNPNMKVLRKLAGGNATILDAYNLLVERSDFNDMDLKSIKNVYTMQEAFICNFRSALDTVYKDDPKVAGLVVALIPYHNIENLNKVSKKLLSKHFLKIVYEPKCLYTDEYFNNAGSRDIEMDSLITLPDGVIEKLNEYSKSIQHTLTLNDLFSATKGQAKELKSIIGQDATTKICSTIWKIIEVNNKIASEFHDAYR